MSNHSKTATIAKARRKVKRRLSRKRTPSKNIHPFHGFWKFPWGYSQTTAIMGTLLCIGFLLDTTSTGDGITLPSWPTNLYFMVGFLGLLIAFSFIVLLICWFG